uniref:Small ribosomal subunit protein mS31 n=1 Tax=Steinernema glaseri TaxID=37863 RepID=A0A1I7YFT2_9BILA
MLSRFVANVAVRRLGIRAFCSAGDDGSKKPKEPSIKDILGEEMLSAVDSVAVSQNPKSPEGRKRMRDALKAKLVEAEKQTFEEATASQTAEMLSQQSVVDLLKSVSVQSTPRVALPSRIRVGKKETIALRREIVYQAIQKGYKASEAQRIAEDAVARAEERMIKRSVETHEKLKAEDAAKIAKEGQIAKEEQEFYDAAHSFFEKLMYDPQSERKTPTAARVEVKKSAPNVFVDDVRALGIFPENGEGLTESRLDFWKQWDAEWVKIYNQSMGPKNGIEEQIEWTKQGKLWPYPINNEYMLGEEEHVGFQDHIFLERFIAKSNLPKKGPIAHFMELVCVGLSKNPHMTARKKVEHLRWFVDYFNEQKVEQVHRLHEAEQQAALNA